MVFGIGATLAFAFGMLWPHVSRTHRGMAVLVCLAIAGFALSLFTGAYLTADAVSAEKREGTLGLLFLTPLRGWQIILGKMAMHSLQVGYALLGAFPVFFLPILLGGVVWNEVVRILVVLGLTLTLSLACGMFYSTVLREVRNAVLATALTMLLLTLLPWGQILIGELFGGMKFGPLGLPQLSPMTTLVYAFESYFRSRTVGHSIFWGSAAWLALASIALIIISGWLLPRIWRKAECGERALAPVPTTAIPRQKRLPKWALPMDKAPLLWLAARDLHEAPWLRWIRWIALIFFAGSLLISATVKRNCHEFFITAFCTSYVLHLIARVQLLLAATRRLHEDRQSGALEAIVVTPVADYELTHAHHESLWHSFRRQFLVLLVTNLTLTSAVFLAFDHLDMDHGTWAIFSSLFVGGAVLTYADFAAIRWLGLRESLRKQTQLKAVGRVFLMVFVIPWVAFGLTFLCAIQTHGQLLVGFIFLAWALVSSLYLGALTSACHRKLRYGFRRHLAEG